MKNKSNWILVIAGVLLIAVGCICLFYPGLLMVTISILVGAFFILSGLSDLIAYFRKRPTSIPLLAYSILDIIIGLMFLLYPLVLSAIVPWIIGFFFILFGVFELAACFKIKKMGTSLWGIMLISGAVSVACGICFFVLPASFALFIGAFVIMRGISMLIQGFSIERMKNPRTTEPL